MGSSRVPIRASVLAGSLSAALLVAASPLNAQECAVTPSLALAIPLSAPIDKRPPLDLSAGPGLGLRLGCRGSGAATLELGADALTLGRLFAAQFFLGGGLRLGVPAGDDAPQFTLLARAGLGKTADWGNGPAVLIYPRADHGGPLVGVAGRVRVPLLGSSRLVLEAAVTRLFLGVTAADGPSDEGGSTGLTTLPLSLGVALGGDG